MQEHSIEIVGAGIGGLATGALLAQQGHKVRIYDQFDAPQPLGSGLMLQMTGLAVLEELGLRTSIEALGSRIDRLWGENTQTGRAVLDVRYAKWQADTYGLGIQRSVLFDQLFKTATAAGVEFVPSSEVVGANFIRPGLILKNGRALPTVDLVVFAHGAGSHLVRQDVGHTLPYGALWTTLPWPDDGPFDATALEQRYEKARKMTGVMASGRTAPGGPLSLTYFWSIHGDDYDRWCRKPLDHWKSEATALWPATRMLLDQITDHSQLTYARYRHHTLRDPTEGRGFVRLGDGWHATSPQLGQGANMALLDAWALSEAFKSSDDVAHALRRFVKLRRGHIRVYQLMSWMFTPVYQGDSHWLPFLRDRLAAPISKIPPAPQILAAMVAGAIGSPLRKLGLR